MTIGFASLAFLLLALGQAPSTCKEHIELLSAKHWARELGRSEVWVLANHKIAVWKNPSPTKFPKVGEMIPGSRALLLEVGQDDYKVRSPLDKSTGWIGKIQVARRLWQDTVTREPCTLRR